MVLSALVCVLVLMADGAGGDQLTLQIGLHCGGGIALYADDDLYAALVEDIHSAAAHAAGNDDLCSIIGQEVGQEAWTVSWIGDRIDCGDGSVCGVEENEILTMAKMACYGVSQGCYCNFQDGFSFF